MNIKKYSHKDHEYNMSFDKKNDQYMVDANQMARPFNKFVADFLRLKQTQSFIKQLEKRYGNSHNRVKVIEVIKGNVNQGTWMCELLALKFASWLSAEFELWVYDQIQELITTGKVVLKTCNQVSLEAHYDPIVQKNNSKAINHKIHLEKGSFKKYNKNSCELHTTLSPKQLKIAGKIFGLKSKDTTSGKQVLRKIEPTKACAMSFTDNYIASNPNMSINDLEYVYNNITSKAEPLFEAMLLHGVKPIELDQQ